MCGTKNSEDANFCEQCGAKMPQRAAVATPKQPTPPTQPRNYTAAPQTPKVQQNQTAFQNRQNIYSNSNNPPVQQRVAPQYVTNQYVASRQAVPTRTIALNQNKKNAVSLYITTLILHALAIIFFFVPYAWSETHLFTTSRDVKSMFQIFASSSFGLAFIIVVIKLFSAFLTSLPLFTNLKRYVLILPIIVTILELLWFTLSIIILFSSKAENNAKFGSSVYTFGLTFGGVLYLLSLLGLLVMLFVTSSKSKGK